jgi:hypothetical protein
MHKLLHDIESVLASKLLQGWNKELNTGVNGAGATGGRVDHGQRLGR